MSGRTGKLTAEALAARGPRFVLSLAVGRTFRHLIIWQEGRNPFRGFVHGDFVVGTDVPHAYISVSTLAKSYTLSYLLRVARGNQ